MKKNPGKDAKVNLGEEVDDGVCVCRGVRLTVWWMLMLLTRDDTRKVNIQE